MSGHYPKQAFTGFRSQYAGRFPNVDALQGKAVVISGTIQLYKGTPEVVLESASQLKVKRLTAYRGYCLPRQSAAH